MQATPTTPQNDGPNATPTPELPPSTALIIFLAATAAATATYKKLKITVYCAKVT